MPTCARRCSTPATRSGPSQPTTPRPYLACTGTSRGRAVISTPTCPLRPLVARKPEAAEIDRGMWTGLVERGLDGVRAESVRCETADCLDEHRSCRVVLELAQEASASGETARR